ncbi:MAG: M24 family metallopeptidase [Haliangiales bacterium]
MAIGYEHTPRRALDRAYRWVAETGSRVWPASEIAADEAVEQGFRHAQRVAYDCVTTVGSELRPGISELEAAEMLARYLRAAGSERFIHRPFAWFGEHSRFDGYTSYGDYHPTERPLGEDEVAILDVSPIIDGYAADVGYSLSLTPHAKRDAAMAFLRELRAALPAMFASPMTPKEIWQAVDQRIAAAGYDNIHARYPFCVLGHRVFRVRAQGRSSRRLGFGGAMSWFSFDAIRFFVRSGFSGALTPEHVGSKLGLWAIEPHIGWEGGGAKFEEILVVDEAGARWLDEQVPHMQVRGDKLS